MITVISALELIIVFIFQIQIWWNCSNSKSSQISPKISFHCHNTKRESILLSFAGKKKTWKYNIILSRLSMTNPNIPRCESIRSISSELSYKAFTGRTRNKRRQWRQAQSWNPWDTHSLDGFEDDNQTTI